MKRLLLGLTFTLAAGSFMILPAPAAHASWVSVNCYVNNASDSHVRRSDAKAYAVVGIGEGYEWGGGCWNNNNVDDTPGLPDSNGEGPDCSGFVFKTWELKSAVGGDGFQWWNRFQNIHGPYTSTSFHAPISGWPFYKLSNKDYSTTMYMDAFAKDGHIGLLYTESQPQDGTDTILEALGDSHGTNLWVESYRRESEYVAVRRRDWTPDCWPSCGMPQRVVAVP